MSFWTPPPRGRYPDAIITPFSEVSCGAAAAAGNAPASGTSGNSVAIFYPLRLPDPFTVSKAFVCNGATTGTNSWDLGIYRMTDMSTGRLDLLRSTGAVLSSGTANVAAEVSAWKVGRVNLTSGSDSTDSTTYTSASITLKAGKLYLASVENSAASAGAISSITNTGAPSFAIADATNGTTQFNGTANRVSVWYCVPTTDYTGTLVITFGATQTGACWSIDEFSGVDTTTNGGIVQMVKGTGNSTTPLATLAAFGSANNATFGAHGVANTSGFSPGSGFTELADVNAATPAQGLETEWRVDNDTTVDATVTSGQWGSVAVEIKADASSFIIPPSLPGVTDIYMAFSVNGTTATFFRVSQDIFTGRMTGMLEKTSTFPLPSNVTPVALSATRGILLAGFSSRSLLA